MRIVDVVIQDAEELLAIYGPYVERTAISFEVVIPELEEFRERIRRISGRYPYLKAVSDEGVIWGYAYCDVFKGRAAYDWSVETTVYVREDQRLSGVGRALYETLEIRLKRMGILNMNACIACPVKEDPYLTMDSIRFHERMGFRLVGTFHQSGYKFRTWYDMVWMEKMIGEHRQDQPEVRWELCREYSVEE